MVWFSRKIKILLERRVEKIVKWQCQDRLKRGPCYYTGNQGLDFRLKACSSWSDCHFRPRQSTVRLRRRACPREALSFSLEAKGFFPRRTRELESLFCLFCEKISFWMMLTSILFYFKTYFFSSFKAYIFI
jgi:hypothetical protein